MITQFEGRCGGFQTKWKLTGLANNSILPFVPFHKSICSPHLDILGWTVFTDRKPYSSFQLYSWIVPNVRNWSLQQTHKNNCVWNPVIWKITYIQVTHALFLVLGLNPWPHTRRRCSGPHLSRTPRRLNHLLSIISKMCRPRGRGNCSWHVK